MFDNLLESRRKKQRSFGTSLVSAIFHIAIVVGAVYATERAPEKAEDQDPTAVFETKLPPKEPPPPDKDTPPPPEMDKAPPPPKGFQTLSAPVNIPTVIPEIDLTASVTNELDFSGLGVKGGIAAGVVGGKGTDNDNQSFFQFEVEKVAQLLPGHPDPVYPEILKSTQQTGKVLISFVIDTTGRADMDTYKVVETSNPLFAKAVRDALPKFRFVPAEIGGRKVRMNVNLPFDFKLGKGGGGNE